MMVEQFGLAMMPLCSRAASAFTSGTTSGTRSSSRQALVLSMTVAPAFAQSQACRRETLPPAEENTMSACRSPPSGSCSNTSSSPRKLTRRPAERADEYRRSSDRGKARSSSRFSISLPTAPLAPTTATRGAGTGLFMAAILHARRRKPCCLRSAAGLAGRVKLAAIVNAKVAPQDWKRLVIKCGTSSLTDESGRLSLPKLWAIGRGVQQRRDRLGGNVVFVSSGAAGTGRERHGLKLRLTLPEKQAAAAVGQALLMLGWARAVAPLPVAQLLLTASDVQDRERYVNARNPIEASLRLGAVPVINEKDSVDTSEIRQGDNDMICAWTATHAYTTDTAFLTDL